MLSNIKTNPREYVEAITLINGWEIKSRLPTYDKGEKVTSTIENQIEEKEKEEIIALSIKARILYPTHLKKDQSND